MENHTNAIPTRQLLTLTHTGLFANFFVSSKSCFIIFYDSLFMLIATNNAPYHKHTGLPFLYILYIIIMHFVAYAKTKRGTSPENQSLGFPTRSDINRAVQPRKKARGLKFRI